MNLEGWGRGTKTSKITMQRIRIMPLQKGRDYIALLNGLDKACISQDENANDIF